MDIKDEKIYRNHYAKRCFRDIADMDYISARVLYKNNCLDQFLVLSQQCLEKYLKAVLLFNDVPCKKSTHSLLFLFKECKRIKNIRLESETGKIIYLLEDMENKRYLTYSLFGRSDYLQMLDRAVFDIRRFCQGDKEKMISLGMISIEDLRRKKIKTRIIFNGELEKILSQNNKDDLRKSLVWKNFYFGKNIKKTIKNFPNMLWAKSSVICSMDDQPIYEALKEYVYFPKKIKEFFEKHKK